MTMCTINQLAGVVGKPIDELLEQISSAGLSATSGDDILTDDDKLVLLNYLRDHNTKPKKKSKLILGGMTKKEAIIANSAASSGKEGRLTSRKKIKSIEDAQTWLNKNESKTIISMDEFIELVDELYNQDLFYSTLPYDVEVYKKIVNVNFDVMVPLRKTNTSSIEEMLHINSVAAVQWPDYQRLITSETDRYNSMLNLFNALRYKLGHALIKIKNPLDPEKDMYSSRQLLLMSECDSNSKEQKELSALIDYYETNKGKRTW